VQAELDSDSKDLLEKLKTAIANKDVSTTKKILNFAVDKGFDFIIALITGQMLK
jgi:hypothetical protein